MMIFKGIIFLSMIFGLGIIQHLYSDTTWGKIAFWVGVFLGLPACFFFMIREEKFERDNDEQFDKISKPSWADQARGLVCIKTYLDEYAAQQDKTTLENHGIYAVITTYYPDGFQRTGPNTGQWIEVKTGGVRLSVKEKDVARANEILKDKCE